MARKILCAAIALAALVASLYHFSMILIGKES
jgi:hypothetical protein